MIKHISLFILFFSAFNLSTQENQTEFADLLVDYYYSNENEKFENFYGGSSRNFPVLIDPKVIFGPNTSHFVSLPNQSYVVVKFTDNEIIDFPEQDDIFITEMGCSGERAEVFVSSDGIDFTKLGIVDDCKTSSLDLNKINYKSVVRFVKIVGLDAKGGSPGYDLVNIKGLKNSSVDSYMNYSLIDVYLKDSEQHTKKIILENVNFNFNSKELDERSRAALSSLYLKIKMYPNLKFKLSGHTDNVGKEDFNLNLSLERAQAVATFLVSKGITRDRILVEGKGQLEPIKSNETEEGRKTNRRVEFQIIK